ncbi:hypothetical protein O0L34_g11633 [Tuta absoluta]|nr:hypothetical protein O0L34_g11633 [Tuta absoluta]
MVIKIFVIICLLQFVVFSRAINNQNDELDSVINLLLNGDNDNNIKSEERSTNNEGGQPILKNGVWKCGNCDYIDENKLIYTEVNDVDTNDINDDRPIVVQVGLVLDSMQCVTVAAPAGATVRREDGACSGNMVTLAVFNAMHFVISVYGV